MLGKGGRPCQGAGMREKAIQIIEKLTAAGYTALLAGGCVRDMLLGREAKDFEHILGQLHEPENKGP